MNEMQDQHDQNYKELSGREGQKKIAELIKGIPIAMLMTVAKDGTINARPMAVQSEPFDGTLWFLTKSLSEKVDEIEQDQYVTLSFVEPSESKYLSVKGMASVNQDRSRIEELWNPMYKAWFPKGKDDPGIAVLRVRVLEAEYWEASSSKVVMLAKYAAAAVTGGKTPVGEAGHVRV